MKIYAITKGQLIIMWIFGFFLWLIAVGRMNQPSFDPLNLHQSTELTDYLFFLIPGILIFYTVGWWNYRGHSSHETPADVKIVTQKEHKSFRPRHWARPRNLFLAATVFLVVGIVMEDSVTSGVLALFGVSLFFAWVLKVQKVFYPDAKHKSFCLTSFQSPEDKRPRWRVWKMGLKERGYTALVGIVMGYFFSNSYSEPSPLALYAIIVGTIFETIGVVFGIYWLVGAIPWLVKRIRHTNEA